MITVFTIDGVEYPTVLVESLKRKFSILDGSNAGRVKTGAMVRDIIGTYYNYTLELDTSEASTSEYDALYEVLSAPQDYHTPIVPYAQSTVTFKAYVTGGEDSLIRIAPNRWSGLSIDFIAMEPRRRP